MTCHVIPSQALSPYFGGIIYFVKDVEPLLERGQRDKIKVDEKRLQQLVRGFATDWKKSIEVLNQDIMQCFTNFKNGTAILQVWYNNMSHHLVIDFGYESIWSGICSCLMSDVPDPLSLFGKNGVYIIYKTVICR